MGDRIVELLRGYFQHYGYWTVAVALLLENAGIPVPGESILLFASFLAFSGRLHLAWIIVVGTLACTFGDNLGYVIGHWGGRPLLDRWKSFFRIRQEHLERGEGFFRRFGSPAIFVARFIFGMRVVAGPLAGVLRMPWKQFALFNFLGAGVWVTLISTLGYLSGQHWRELWRLLHEVSFGLLAALAMVVVIAWLVRRKKG
jgi:membrane-associated protein